MTQPVEARPGNGVAASKATGVAESARENGIDRVEAANGKMIRITGALNLLRQLAGETSTSRIDITGDDLWGMFELIGIEAESAHGDVLAAQSALIAARKYEREPRHAA